MFLHYFLQKKHIIYNEYCREGIDMKDFWSKYNTFGKILAIISFLLIIVGMFFGDIKTWIGFCAISCICDYIAFQYGSTKEYYDKVLANKMHKPSRNLFALFFSITMIIISCFCFGILAQTKAIYLGSASILASCVACVLNEYGINGKKKIKALISCFIVALAIGFVIYLNSIGFFL